MMEKNILIYKLLSLSALLLCFVYITIKDKEIDELNQEHKKEIEKIIKISNTNIEKLEELGRISENIHIIYDENMNIEIIEVIK